MFKTIIITVLVCGIIFGAAWYSIGRNDLGEIRKDYDRADRTLQRVLSNNSELGTHVDGFAGDITTINTTSRRIEDRSGSIDEGLSIIDGDIRGVTGEVGQLERWNRQALVITRDFGDQLYELRQINKESGN
jgi:hypothetical protein